MGRVERQIAKEGVVLILDYEIDGVIGEVVRDIARAAYQRAVVIKFRTEIQAPMAGCEAIIFVETAGVRMIWKLRPIVPLAKGSGRIAGGSERFSDSLLIEVEPLSSSRHTSHPAARMIAAGEKLSASWRADGADIEPVKDRAVP